MELKIVASPDFTSPWWGQQGPSAVFPPHREDVCARGAGALRHRVTQPAKARAQQTCTEAGGWSALLPYGVEDANKKIRIGKKGRVFWSFHSYSSLNCLKTSLTDGVAPSKTQELWCFHISQDVRMISELTPFCTPWLYECTWPTNQQSYVHSVVELLHPSP